MKQPPDMHEGLSAFDRFRRAMKAIVSVPKSAVVPERKKTTVPKKKRPPKS